MTDIAFKNAARLRARTKRLNTALVGSHVAVVLGIVGVITFGYKAPVEASPSLNSQTLLERTTSVDQIAAATVASTVAQTLDLSIETNVESLAVSLNAKTELAQTDNTFLTKPQIVEQNSGRAALEEYVTKQGDTVQSVAAAFSVSEDTIRWANNLTVDNLGAGRTITIPGTTGVVYTVKSGDTTQGLADKYKADKDRIVLYNDLELKGLVVGERIVIPGGILPDAERPGYRAPSSRYNSGVTVSSIRATIFAGNGYAYGYCTWYAYNRRAELGRPIGSRWGNAVTWASYAKAAGYRVDRTPEVGAVFQVGGGWGGLGHVGVVERINADGSIHVSEMNYRGWNKISERDIVDVSSYNYIH